MDIIQIMAHAQTIISALVAICGAVITIALIFPGPQPEKALQGIVDFLSKFSKK